MNDACQVDFYVLHDSSQSAELLACRLALMAWQKGNRIMVLAQSEPQAERLDTLMWEHPQGRFLPHARSRPASPAPVIIGTITELTDGAGEVIINLSQEAVPRPQRFGRLLELVPANDAQRQAFRNKFRAYRALGLKPESHSIE
jgi:DNA polymerase-3 subunit chi